MSFPRYPNYKDSGVEWLGEVPGHWEVTRLRYVTNIRKGKLPRETYPTQSASSDLPYLSMEFLRGDTETPHYVPESPSLLCAEDDDVLLLWDGSNAGEFLRAKRGVVSSTVAHLSGINIDRDFLFYACKAIQRGLQDQTIGMGIPHVSGDELRTRAIACPQIAEQTQIAAFLDRETAKIDELVAEQRRLMELLKEKRQAVISHAVTQGLNPHTPMKPSGIEWLGDVPEHWEVVQFKQFVDIQNGSDHKHVEQTEGYPVLGSGGVFTYASEFLYDGESVLLGRKGTIDKPLHITGRFWTVDTMYWTKISPDVSGRFTYYSALTIPFDFYSTNTALPSMTKGALSSHRVAFPPLHEQTQIAAFLDSELAKFDTLTAEAQRAIDLLQERRTALISVAVTGQIDVRPFVEREAA